VMSTKHLARRAPLALPLVLATACANYATLQEAETTPKGTSKTGVGATFTTYEVEFADEPETVSVPALNVWYRRGLTDQLEAHASVWIPLGASLGVKYQLLGDRTRSGLAFSLGLDLGFLQITSGSDDREVTTTIVDTYVPLYVGYRLSPSLALYASPKYILRSAFGDGDTSIGHLAGSTLGVAAGARTTLLLEGTVMYDVTVGAPALQAGVGVAF
jgi:hypothetical protein